MKHWLVGGCFVASMMVLTGVAPAAVHECVAKGPTTASYTWDFHQEATDLFGNIQADAARVADQSAYLERETSNADLTWESYGAQLGQIKDAVNDMSAKWCRLASIRRVLAPWQQQTVDRIAS